MKILYDETGKIYYTVPDKDWFWFTHSTNVPLTVFEIDELPPDNKAICIDLLRTVNKINASGLGKYYIDGQGQLMERNGWIEHVMEVF